MCEKCTEANQVEHPADLSRRTFLLAGAALAATPVVASAAPGPKEPAVENGPFPTRAWAASSATSGFAPIRITRRALLVNKDVRYRFVVDMTRR
ncbi:MAG TPA: hypothetical protein VD838_14095 [Anaeromyxobacteraceae bacterium]|nr:hypothetical protein [Anaeromyxobacteraceae bacterium]